MAENSDIDSVSLPPVKNLRSKFEQLALDTSPNTRQRLGSGLGGGDLLQPGSPRPRASSNTLSNSTVSDIHHLRSSSSSSDLKVSGKRPPPPPPPSRGSKPTSSGSPIPSPSPSPLLRPVPTPPSGGSISNVSLSSPRIGSSSLPTSVMLPPSVNVEPEDVFVSQSVASLRNKFSTHSPRQSISAMYPAIQSEPNLETTNIEKPPVPPRASKVNEPPFLSPPVPATKSPDQMAQSSFPPSHGQYPSLLDDENTDTETALARPALPARRSPSRHHHHQGSSTTSLGTQSSDSSQTSSESDLNKPTAPPPKNPRLTVVPPPRPPPRHRSSAFPISISSEPSSSSSSLPSSTSTTIAPPPPLPFRRNTVAQIDELPLGPPRLPIRPQLAIPSYVGPIESPTSSPGFDRKSIGLGKLPPPPTRTIALGDKLPPARRPPSPSSDEDSGEEEDSKSHGSDTLPDSSRSSRRPPVLSFREGYTEPRIQVPAYSGHVLVSGRSVVVATGHHIKVYDLAVSDIPSLTLDTKDFGAKDAKIMSMEFRPSANKSERGYLLWIGTKEGHLFEFDIRTGTVLGTKLSAHLHSITHIFRHGRSMITVDDAGKVLIFAPDSDGGEDVSLSYTQPRVVRIADKQDFVKMLGGKLWASARGDSHGAGTTAKTPIIRVYDILAPGSTGKSVLPAEHVGPVISATILPSQPGFVYMGHEEGYITLWALETEDGYPKCVEVMKVSTSDVLSLEGVNDRLWAGSRNGMISAYDVTYRPWVVTNSWNAHPGLPVLRLMVDQYGIERAGRMCVASVGRDEQLKLWDGLLGLDWIDQELIKHETSFSRFRDLTVLLVSWNVDAARPDSLSGDPANLQFLHDVLASVDSPDIISFGFQEVIDLESRKMAAKNVLLGSKKKPEDGGLSEKVTGAYKRWYDRLLVAVRMAMPPEVPYSVIHTESLVGLFSCIFVKNTERSSLNDIAITTIKRGMGGRYGNKGGIVARFVIEDTSICLINCHLAAGQNAVRARNSDVAGMLEEKAVFPATDHPLAYVGGGDGSMVLDHEIVFVNGDMNYRIDHRRDAIAAAVRANDLESLLGHDQLLREIKFNRGFRFRGFSEGPLAFAPTYKYDRRSTEYDSSEKRRSPAWCDRVLWRSRVAARVNQLHYRRYEANVSDHRPISAAFTMTIKSMRHEVREKVKAEVEAVWIDQQHRLLVAAQEFYIRQALV